jgi:hypothetical protein
MKARTLIPLNWVQWLSLLTTMIVVVLLPIIIIQGRAQRVQANEGIRTFICFFEQAALKSPHQTPQQVHRIHVFFSNVLTAIHQPPCGS